jgi:hypothetical protein
MTAIASLILIACCTAMFAIYRASIHRQLDTLNHLVRILSGAHCNHYGALVRVTNTGKALVRLRDGACVWVEDGEWVRVSP